MLNKRTHASKAYLDVDLSLRRVTGLHPGAFPNREPFLRGDPGGLQGRGGVHDHHAERTVRLGPHRVVVLHHQDHMFHLFMPVFVVRRKGWCVLEKRRGSCGGGACLCAPLPTAQRHDGVPRTRPRTAPLSQVLGVRCRGHSRSRAIQACIGLKHR